ncbi:MAG: helix-turn-helix domain-containing protein [Candidatus Doudnabacteria bacterium]|nr:helix-turn-helix domain-containing protein [Candidatus Doudnabacteria bacterium]
MAKFPRKPKLDKRQTQDLIIDFCEAIAATKNSQEAAQLLTDLLGKQELEMLARRLKVAELLLQGYIYDDIQKLLKMSRATIARVQSWLQNSGEGYRLVIERTKGSRQTRWENEKPFKLSGMKKKYPMYYWPQIVLEYWVKNSSQKHKREMLKLISKIEEKPKIYKELETLLKEGRKVP